MRILLVEDDGAFAQAVVAVLAQQNYVVDVAEDGETGWEFTRTWEYDLIVLDVMLPKLDGVSLCRQLREHGYSMPILLLTAKDAATDKVLGLDAGADDYVVKPIDFQELAARIRALLRRGGSGAASILEWADLCLDPRSCEVTYRGQALQLTPTEYSLVELFLRNPQRVFSRSAIIENLWTFEDPPGEDTIRSHIKGLRQKLKSAAAPTDFIETVYGLGYRLKPQPDEPLSQTSEDLQLQAEWLSQQTLLGIAKAKEDFKAGMHQRLSVLEQAIAALATGTLSDELRQRAEQEAHKLAGSLGSFGFEHSSQLAREIEPCFQGQKDLGTPQAHYLGELLKQLRQDLEQPPKALQTNRGTLAPQEQCQNILLAVSNDLQFMDGLTRETAPRQTRVETVPSPAAAKAFLDAARPDVVLLELCPYYQEESLILLTELSRRTPPVPVIVVTDQDNFSLRLEVARRGSQGFVPKSIPAKDLLDLADQVMQRSQAREVSVMVLDDDPQLLMAVRDLLEPWGFKLITLEDPRHLWGSLGASCPDLLILDVEMPHINGIELCQVVRNDPQWRRMPVLFLTVHTDAQTVDRIFTAGADDYVSKVGMGAELVRRIFNRLGRPRSS